MTFRVGFEAVDKHTKETKEVLQHHACLPHVEFNELFRKKYKANHKRKRRQNASKRSAKRRHLIALDDVMLEDDDMDISDSEIPENLLDVLYKNCQIYCCCLELGCLDPENIFNVQKPKREFQCSKCSRL